MQLSGGNLSCLYFIVLFKKSVWRNSLLKAEGMQHSDRKGNDVKSKISRFRSPTTTLTQGVKTVFKACI